MSHPVGEGPTQRCRDPPCAPLFYYSGGLGYLGKDALGTATTIVNARYSTGRSCRTGLQSASPMRGSLCGPGRGHG